MESAISPQIQDNGTFMPTEKILDGQPQILNALVINKSLQECAEIESQLRVGMMQEMGKGVRIDSEI